MPIYSYKCTKCNKEYDAFKSFDDSDKDDICPSCGAVSKRMITEPGAVIYKGSGYYCTDHKEGCNCASCKGKS